MNIVSRLTALAGRKTSVTALTLYLLAQIPAVDSVTLGIKIGAMAAVGISYVVAQAAQNRADIKNRAPQPYKTLCQGTVQGGDFEGVCPGGILIVDCMDSCISVTVKNRDVRMIQATVYESDGCFVEIRDLRHEGADSSFMAYGWCGDDPEPVDSSFMFTVYGYGID